MTQTGSALKHAGRKTEEKLDELASHPWIERIARFGYATKGVVYMVVGALALLTALGLGGDMTNKQGALRIIAAQPYGKAMLIVIGFGLIGYVVWRLVQSIADADQKGRKLKGLAVRTAYAISGLVYAGLAWTSMQIVFDYASSNDDGDAPKDWTARLMSVPYGRWLVIAVGAGIIGFGLYQIYKGYKAKFRKRLKSGEMQETMDTWATWSGRFGYAARGICFDIIGVFLVQAAWYFNPDQAIGLDGALLALAQTRYGPWLLGLIALGLFTYGFYMLVEARYRRIAGA
ncbi:MAG TPA: DUF1206 domain-containing protein [Pyrinomonadaceae bacterium]|jgi:hypothetical protein